MSRFITLTISDQEFPKIVNPFRINIDHIAAYGKYTRYNSNVSCVQTDMNTFLVEETPSGLKN